jgi:hypothetical protein
MSENQLVALCILIAVLFLWCVVMTLVLMYTRAKLKKICVTFVEDCVKAYQLRMTNDNMNRLENRTDNNAYVLALLIKHLGLEYVKKEVRAFEKIDDKKK